MEKNEKITSLLSELLTLCSIKRIEIEINQETSYSEIIISLKPDNLTINIPNIEDEKLIDIISAAIKKVKESH